MVVEALLPSEIARLVYGYLIEEKCTETAKSFLKESPNLAECRNILRCGRPFTTHIGGLHLSCILDKFCTINNIVQEQLTALRNTHKLRICNDIVIQIKFLLQVATSRNEHVQSYHEGAISTPSKTYKKRYFGKNENRSNVAAQSDDGYQTETPPDSNSIQNISSIEATPVEHLPGYIESLQSKKYDSSQSVAVKTSTKISKKCMSNQQIKENAISQAVQTSINEMQEICSYGQTEKTVQSQEVQTSFRISNANKLLIPHPITDSIQKEQFENIKTSEKNVNRQNTDRSITCVQDKLSSFTGPASLISKTNLYNNLGYCGSNQEMINLDNSKDETSLKSPIIEEVKKNIDDNNSSSEENISNEDVLIVEEKNQYNPDVVRVSSIKESPVLRNVASTTISRVANEVISTQKTITLDSELSDKAQKCTDSMPNNIPYNREIQKKHSVNSMEPSLFDKNFPNPTEFPDHNTSTPLKLFISTQNYETNQWFSTETLPSSNIVSLKETAATAVNGNCSYTQTATENIVSSVDGFISPIICKENAKVAQKISLNCLALNAEKDDTLHTPDVPSMIKSFVSIMPCPVLAPNVPPKDKIPVLLKNTDEENITSNSPPVQETSSGFVSISSLVKNTEFNRYFSIDSISVTQMENTTNTVQNSATIPDIQIEDSVEFNGLCPFLKMHKKTKEGNAKFGENENNATTDIVGDTNEEALLNAKIDETNPKVTEIAKNNALDSKSSGSECELKEIQVVMSESVINPLVYEFVAQSVINKAKETAAVTGILNNGTNVNDNVTIKKIDNTTMKNIDLKSKDASNQVDDRMDNEAEEDVELVLDTAVGEIIEKSERREVKSDDTTSKIHDQINTAATSVFISNQMVNAKHVESKVKTGSANKASLKSFISKTFELYIDTNKDNTTSNHNNETVMRNTPKALVEERAKSQRRSLSTPKKSSSHIRALTFETPIQSRSDSKIGDKTRCASPESAKRNLKRMHESFQSPPVVNDDFDNRVRGSEEAPIAANGVNGELHDEKMTNAIGKLSQDKEMKKENVKKSWDSDLRLLCQMPEQPKVEIPKRKYKTKSKEESSDKKKKRDKLKTPRKEKKCDKSPHKNSRKNEKDKAPKKSKKREKSRESEYNDGKSVTSKTEDQLLVKDCKDLGAQIENNLILSNEIVNNDEAKRKVGEDELSVKKCKDTSIQIENNLLSTKSIINKLEIKSKVTEKLFTKECKDISTKVVNNLLSLENKNVKNNVKVKITSNERIWPTIENKTGKNNEDLNEATNKLNSNVNQQSITDIKATESSKIGTDVLVISTQYEIKECPPTIVKTAAKKDPFEYLLSDNINEDEIFDNTIQVHTENILQDDELTKVNKSIDSKIAKKMQQDEQAIAAVLQEANNVINEKFKSIDVVKQQDFFPETSLMTDGDESEEENEGLKEIPSLTDDISVNSIGEKLGAVNNVQLKQENNKNAQTNKKQNESEQITNKTLCTLSKSEVDYESIEKQLSILTNTEVSPSTNVIYEQVNKLEDGKVVNKKYVRFKTLDKTQASKDNLKSLAGCEIERPQLLSSIKEDESMQMPPTPQIVDPGSSSWNLNPVINEDSRTIPSSIPTPLECPPTPKIFITPQKVEEENTHIVPEVKNDPPYRLTLIDFGTDTKKPDVTKFEVVKETLKETIPKTSSEKKVESATKKIPSSLGLSSKDNSLSRLDSEDSESSSSSNSSDSSSSSSSDDDDNDGNSLLHPAELAKENTDLRETKPQPEKEPELIVQSEEVVAGNEVIYFEREEVVVAQEASPTKVFSIHKTDKELAETIKETPAKDENMIPEEGIFETPNISKPVENPTNLHAKISQIMILKEQEEIRRLERQQKPKIINIERVIPKITIKNLKQQEILPPGDVTAKVSQKVQVKTNIVEKSEAEVAKAIESIANEKFDESQDILNASIASSITSRVPTDKLMKRELTKAIQSITEENEDEDNSESSSNNSSNDSDPNLELVLEDNVKLQLNDESSLDESYNFSNSEVHNTEIHVVFDEKNHRKRRRTEYFTDEDLQQQLQVEVDDGDRMVKLTASCLYMLFNVNPFKKKAAPRKKIKEVKEKQEEEYDDGDSSEDFVPVRNAKGGTKRRRLDDEPKSRKRKKNIFIY